MKPRIVLSGVNLVEAGPLAIFKDALDALSQDFLNEYEVIALVHSSNLFDTPGIIFLEFPAIKSSWIRRLHFEYFTCRSLSQKLHTHLWLSMHDITPNVHADIQAVYCHNPAPFYSLPWHEARLDKTFALFHWLYSYLYRINIANNDFVIVQQDWLRKEFNQRYAVREVVVARPSLPFVEPPQTITPSANSKIFFYPAYPRCFKNIELLLEAAALLEADNIIEFKIWITVNGYENRYAAWLLRRFGQLKSVHWLGFQPRSRIEEMYAVADCLVFPSKLESWGMPISEFARTGKQILLADLPYAHETVGNYHAVHFFPSKDATALAKIIRSFMAGDLVNSPAKAEQIPVPVAPGWKELFHLLLQPSTSNKA